MAQFGRPSADTYNGDGWVEDDGTAVAIFDQIDEAVLDDADYIKSPVAPTSDVYVTKLSNLEDPVSSTGHTVRVRHQKDAAGGAVVNLTAELRQGYVSEASQGTLIATVMSAVALSDVATTTTYTLSGAEADAITDYTSLYLRFLANQV